MGGQRELPSQKPSHVRSASYNTVKSTSNSGGVWLRHDGADGGGDDDAGDENGDDDVVGDENRADDGNENGYDDEDGDNDVDVHDDDDGDDGVDDDDGDGHGESTMVFCEGTLGVYEDGAQRQQR